MMYKSFSFSYRMKTYGEFNLATGLYMVKFTELNISNFSEFLIIISYRTKTYGESALSEIVKFKIQ